MTVKRGRVFSALKACYLRVMLTVAPQDAAERHRRYISTTIKKADNVNCLQLISRMVAMNDMTAYLPCLKQMEDSPSSLPQMDKPFSEMEMCMYVLAALPHSISSAYWASKGHHFPLKIEELKSDLKLVETQVQRQNNMFNELRAKAGLTSKGKAGESKAVKMKPGDPIPKKQKTSKDATRSLRKRKCDCCAEWSPAIQYTHNTEECRKWHKDGNPKKRTGPPSKNQYHVRRDDDTAELKVELKLMKKQNKKFEKLLLSKKRKKRVRYESSSDSGSDSE